MKQIETVAVVGLGAVGAVVAEQLLSVLGNKLYCVMDAERKARYQASGIVINGKRRTSTLSRRTKSRSLTL